MNERAELPVGTFSAHRVEALADGVFAIAMTLLVIELKLPDAHTLHTADQVAQALAELTPKAIAWFISFFVLALFWVGHHRVFGHVKRADGPLITLNLLELGAVALMPFSCALTGEFPDLLISQVVYSINMFLLGITALFVARYIHRHPELSSSPMPTPIYEGARLRIGGVMAISVIAALIAWAFALPTIGDMAFMLMAVINPLSRRIERRKLAQLSTAATP